MTTTFGVLNDSGKAAKRFTFIIDKQGVVRKIYSKVTPKDHPAEVVTFIKENLTK